MITSGFIIPVLNVKSKRNHVRDSESDREVRRN